MIGVKTELGLRKDSGRIIALTLASISQGQPEVTQLILHPIVIRNFAILISL